MFTSRGTRTRTRTRQSARPEQLRAGSGQTARFTVEGLETRLLLYAVSGGEWPHPERVTVSFMPDTTLVGGVPSVLFTTMNLRFPTGTWQKEMLRGLQSFAANANLNFSLVGDDGSPLGSPGFSGTDYNVQGDSNFGDIRIGSIPFVTALGYAQLPPPINPGTEAGDFQLNSLTAWNIGSTYDLFTVSAHEAGHSLGLCHSSVSSAVLYESYNGVKSNLTADDIAGIQAIYGARPADGFDAADPNETKGNATVITSFIDSNKQVTLTNLDITNNGDVDWYKFTTPGGTSNMEVRVQSTGLSLFAPKFTLFKGTNNKGTVSGPYHSTVSQTEAISGGQNWFVKVEGAEQGAFGTGSYALQINMGSTGLPAVLIPDTATPASGDGQPGCESHWHDHEQHSETVAHDDNVVITETVRDEVRSETRSSAFTVTLGTNFDLKQSPLAAVFQADTTNDAFEARRHERRLHTDAVDFAIDGGLAGLLANKLV